MIAIQNGDKQSQILPKGGIESRRIAAVDSLGFCKIGQLAIAEFRIEDMPQRQQVSLVASERVALIVRKIAHTFGHAAPYQVTRPILARAVPEDFKLPGLIDNRFDS